MRVYYIIIFCLLMTVSSQFTAKAQTGSQIKTLPDIELKLQNNEKVKLKALKGKVVLLDFWFKSCFPCLQSVPYLIELQEEFKDDLIIIGMNDHDSQESVIDYFGYKKANYRSTYKTEERLFQLFNVTEYPTTILYDRDGNIIKANSGFSKGEMKLLRKAIKKALE